MSVQRFYLYAESGLSRQRVSIWIYEWRTALRINRRYWRGIRVTTIGSMGNAGRAPADLVHDRLSLTPAGVDWFSMMSSGAIFNGIPPETTPSV